MWEKVRTNAHGLNNSVELILMFKQSSLTPSFDSAFFIACWRISLLSYTMEFLYVISANDLGAIDKEMHCHNTLCYILYGDVRQMIIFEALTILKLIFFATFSYLLSNA